MLGRPLSHHQVLSINIYRGCGIAGGCLTREFCLFVVASADSSTSLPFKGNKGGSHEKQHLFP
jgi:hypothetical protein